METLATVPPPAGALAEPPPATEAARAERALGALRSSLGDDAGSLPSGWDEAARGVLAASVFVERFARQHPHALAELLTSGRLARPMEPGEHESLLRARLAADGGVDGPDEAALFRVLRRFRRTEGVRIAWRDLAGLAAIDDTLAEQSALADACIRIALEMLETRARARFGTPRAGDGTPQSLLVLGMGKLGGRELNFSSDIDLIFLYGERGATDGARSLDNGDFFTRLGQELIRALQETTAEGFVYRVDMRLRPFGSSGPLVMHLEQLEQYLLTQAREWERFALVKARPVTGDPATVAEVDGLLRPFVFRRYLDFGAFEALRDLKLRLEREVERKGLHGNVKYGRGGIREVEFIAQAFQLIRGGRESRLRTRGLLDALEALRHLGELEPATVDALSAAYRHLRAVENRLQAWGDERAHDLPVDPGARARLAWTLGEADWSAFGARLDGHMAAVHECFGEVFNVSEDEEPVPRDPLAEAWEGTVDAEVAEARLGDAGFDEPAEIRRRLETLRASSRYRSLTRTARERFDRLVPLLLAEAGRVQAPGRTLGRLLTLMEAVARRSVYLSLLTEHAAARGRLVELCAASPWIAEFVTRHPILLDELIDPGSLYAPPDRASVEREIAEALEGIGDDDLESQMDALRQVRQANVLRVAAVDITGRLPLMRVSDRLTWIAEAMLEAVHRLVRRQAVARYGRPRALLDDGEREPGFGIVAYGKLGGIELGYGSDLDLVFLHEGGEDRGTDGERAVDNATFFARLAQRMVHFLNTPTPAGTLYEIDTRLRPNGSAGLLVSTLPAFARYQGESAWTWEHQALVRARMIVGPEPLRTRFEAVRAEVLRRGRDRPALARAVVDMRDRMRRELSKGSADRFDLKQDRGGVADIEFMVQYGVLAGAHATPALVDFTDNIRLLEALATAGELAAGDASLLTDAYRAFRTRIHRLALLDAPAIVEPDAELAGYREAVTRIWSHWIEAQAGDPHESGH